MKKKHKENNKITKSMGFERDFLKTNSTCSDVVAIIENKQSPKTPVKISTWSNVGIKNYSPFDPLF